jgi:hypothetical protein
MKDKLPRRESAEMEASAPSASGVGEKVCGTAAVAARKKARHVTEMFALVSKL